VGRLILMAGRGLTALVERRNRDFVPLLAARVLQLANGFLISIALVWTYGLAGAGTYAIAAFGASILSLVSGLGLVNALPLQALSNPQRATAGLLATSALLLPTLGLSLAYGWYMAAGTDEALTIAAFAFGGFFLGQSNVLQMLYILQGRAGASPIPHIVTGAGIALGAFISHGAGAFAVIVLAGRVLGNLVGFALLAYRRISWPNLRSAFIRGTSFAPADAIAMLSEQLPILIISVLLSRAELGIFGLARQIVTAADAPGWSFVQAKYPELVESKLLATPAVARSNGRLAVAVGGCTLLASMVLSVAVYRQPVLVGATAVLLATLPARYMNNLYDQVIRAGGWARCSANLALAKLALSVALFYALTAASGLWGAILASAFLSLSSGLIYRGRVASLVPNLLPSLRRASFS